jgi:hypothetical protein
MLNKLFGVLAIMLGFKLLIFKKIQGNWAVYDFSDNYMYFIVSILCFYVGWMSFQVKEKKAKYTKCPNCKKTFNYSELKNGKCKYCKDIDTIEVEEYYKKR